MRLPIFFSGPLYFLLFLAGVTATGMAQTPWQKVDSLYGPLPENVHVYRFAGKLGDSLPSVIYYAEFPLRGGGLAFASDTSKGRRLTPDMFYEKNNHPLLVLNTTYFSFESNRSVTLVIKDGKVVEANQPSVSKAADTRYRFPFVGSLGIFRNGRADVAYTMADSASGKAWAVQSAVDPLPDSDGKATRAEWKKHLKKQGLRAGRWKPVAAMAAGPVLLQKGEIRITNNKEMKQTGKTGIDTRHPRTLIGYTADGRLITMAIQGRFPGLAEGASLTLCAKLMQEAGCAEALNLDGGGSSCMLINGKNTITPSDKQGVQRPVPAVFLVHVKGR